MNTQVKSSNGITLVPIETRLLANRKILIKGEINDESAFEFVEKMMLLTEEDSKKTIDVLINSPGGQIDAGLLMYDVIQGSIAPIRMFCLGEAFSMAAVLFSCGRYGRYILPHSKLMLHEPLIGNNMGGNASSIKSISDNLIEARNKINKILSKHTGKTEQEIEIATSFDHYFSSKESVEFGLADEIIEFNKIIEE